MPKCALSKRKSIGEIDLLKNIEDIIKPYGNFKIICSDRKILAGKEIDIYIPALAIAFEFNGDYWHSDYAIKARSNYDAITYHSRKFEKAKAAGIILAHVWESDWVSNSGEVITAIEEFVATKKLSPILTKYEGIK